jgi:tetratricopeptide (TPR) repeat protein
LYQDISQVERRLWEYFDWRVMVLKKVMTLQSSKLDSISKINTIFACAFVVLATIVAFSVQQPALATTGEFPNSDVNWYDSALAVNQNNVPALVEKGTELVATGNPGQALTWLDKALNIDAKNMMGLVSKGTALRELGEYQEAINMYDRVLAIDPHDEYAIGGKADSLYMSGQHEKAITWINKALSLNPTDAKIQFVKESLIQAIN